MYMAQVPIRVSATIKDEWGIEASTAFFGSADDTQTLALVDTQCTTLLADLDACTGGQITAARVTVFPSLAGLKTAPAAGARVEQTGLLGFSATGTTKRYTASIPALSNGATVLSGDRIVLTGVDPVGVLIALLTAVGTIVRWVSDHNQAILAFIDAIVAFRKKRKQLQRASFEV
jgi:hypothetical protein